MEDLAASIAISNKNNVWISDHMVTKCYNCKSEFGLFLRKHHCRNCGNIFCHYCCKDYVIIPDFITDRPDPADVWNISYYISSLKTNEERVCSKCNKMIKEKTAAYDKIATIFNNPVPLDKIKELPDTDNNIKNHYFDHLRNIQYYLPNHEYTDIDRKLLMVNAPYLSKHSKYIVHLIKSIEWDLVAAGYSQVIEYNRQQLQFVVGIINGEKNKKCSELYCTRTCQEQLSCDDCINILYSVGQNLPDQLLNWLFEIIINTPEQIILCHLPFFISLIKNNKKNKTLQTLIFRVLNKSIRLIYHTFWFLNNELETSNEVQTHSINSIIQLFNTDMKIQMHREYCFFKNLINNLSNPSKFLSEEFPKIKPISLPYEPDVKIVDVELDTIHKNTSSYTKPTIITFIIAENENSTEREKLRLLFKKESIQTDITVLNLMMLSDIILSESTRTNFGAIVYPVMPLTSNSGMIEIVEDAETVHTIMNNHSSILQYIMYKNSNKIVGDVLQRYLYSLVSYTLHSYFIGLGDRHLQNIMIMDDGSIFHIDFGFILGTDAYPIATADVKLNSGMLDVIGGSNGDDYKKYLELCSIGVVVLRKYFNMFFILLSQNNIFSNKHIERFIMSRFQPRQIDKVVIDELISIIRQSNTYYTSYVRDFLHYHTQEKTIQNGLIKAFGNMIDVVKNLSSSS